MARTIKVPAWKFKVPRLPQVDPNTPDVFDEMTLQEHLIELRDRIMKVCIAIGVGLVLGAILAKPLLERIVKDANVAETGLDISGPAEPLTIFFKVALYIAISLTLPFTLYQLIAFLAPGLTRKEKRILFTALPFITILFLSGVAYGFFVAAPRALYFLSNFLPGIFNWDPDGPGVLSFFLTLMMGLGISFQLPVLMYVVAKIGIITAKQMRQWRKYAYLILMIAAAVITPSTDPINLMIVAIPLVILYEIGVVIAAVFAKTSLRDPEGPSPAAA